MGDCINQTGYHYHYHFISDDETVGGHAWTWRFWGLYVWSAP